MQLERVGEASLMPKFDFPHFLFTQMPKFDGKDAFSINSIFLSSTFQYFFYNISIFSYNISIFIYDNCNDIYITAIILILTIKGGIIKSISTIYNVSNQHFLHFIQNRKAWPRAIKRDQVNVTLVAFFRLFPTVCVFKCLLKSVSTFHPK